VNLTDLFPGSTAKVLTVLLDAPRLPWTRKMLASSAQLDERTVRRILTRLWRLGIVIVNQRFSAGAVITLNSASMAAAALAAFHEALKTAGGPEKA